MGVLSGFGRHITSAFVGIGRLGMRARFVWTFIAVLGVAAVGVAAQQPFVFFASIADSAGNPVPTLAPEDLKVQENGTEGKVLKIEPIDWPITLELLVDNGTGMADLLVQIRNGLKGLVMAIPNGVEMTLISTAPQPRNIVKPTTDREAILQGIDRITPDTGAARFVEALNESAARVEKDKRNVFPVVVILGSTTAEGSNVLERDVQKMLQRYTARAATVHVVMLNVGARSQNSISGANQTIVGSAVAQQTGGRYDAIAASTRLATLLPEIGMQVAKSHARQSHQFRITLQRPNGGSGPIGDIGLSTRPGTTPTLTINGRMP
jgi:von Willebrand factor type A domain